MRQFLSKLVLISFVTSVAEAGKLEYNKDVPLYTSDRIGYTASDVPALLDDLNANGEVVLIFVHGRGNEPNKSLNGATFIEGRAVHKLEKQYQVPVVMFNWNSKAFLGDRDKPLSRMDVASKSLHTILTAIADYQGSVADSPSLVLLVHSMGSIVVETMVNKQGWPADEAIFKTVLFSAPDSDNLAHEQWLEKIASIENVFLTVNRDDKALRRSDDARSKGVKPVGVDPGMVLAKSVSYVEVTGLGDKDGKAIKTHEIPRKSDCRYVGSG